MKKNTQMSIMGDYMRQTQESQDFEGGDQQQYDTIYERLLETEKMNTDDFSNVEKVSQKKLENEQPRSDRSTLYDLEVVKNTLLRLKNPQIQCVTEGPYS